MVLDLPEARAKVTVDQLEYLLDRPAEPVFLPKESSSGKNKVVFNVPEAYLVRTAGGW